jgi:hypothetical protein
VAGPEPPGGAELRDLLEKVVVAIEEERQPLPERVDVQACGHRGLHVRNPVGEREADFLSGRRSGFTNVIPADRDRVPPRQLALTESEDVGDDPHRRAGRVDVCTPRDVLLENVVLDRSLDRGERDFVTARHRRVQREQDDRGRVDGHRGGHALERDPAEELGHVFERVDRHADPAHLAAGHRVVRVVPHLRRQVERDAQAADAVGQ